MVKGENANERESEVWEDTSDPGNEYDSYKKEKGEDFEDADETKEKGKKENYGEVNETKGKREGYDETDETKGKGRI